MTIQGYFGRNNRTRTNERHLAPKNIQQLRELIQTPAAKESTEGGDSRISEALVELPVEVA
jgi:hypothetical protein